MDALPIVFLSRLLHILAAVMMLGGTMFVAFALRPAAKGLSESEHEAFHDRLMAKWRGLVGIAIGVLIFTGFYNYLVVAMPEHKAVGDSKYHMFLGIKILLAFVVFFLASVLPGRAQAFEKMRQNTRLWTTITILLAVVVVAIGSYLRVRGLPTVG